MEFARTRSVTLEFVPKSCVWDHNAYLENIQFLGGGNRNPVHFTPDYVLVTPQCSKAQFRRPALLKRAPDSKE